MLSLLSVIQSCLTLCPMLNCSTPGLPVHQQLLELTQTHVHWVSDGIQPSHALSSPSASIFPSIRAFSNESVLCIRWPNVGALASASVLIMNIQDWLPLWLTALISLQSKGLWRVFSNTVVQAINSSVFNFLCSPALTSIHDYWKNHSLDGPLLAK